jgi:uncharacterized protein YndB with AHSA1/START domain
MIEPIRIAFDVACPAGHAFTIWTARTSAWWPASHSVSTESGLAVVFEPRVGGRIYERTPSGVEHDWGRILTWEPPRRIVYRWHLRSDAADATEVEITFTPEAPDRTRVQIEHRGWDRLGAAAPERRQGNLAGWGGLLPHFVAATQDPAFLASLDPLGG